MKTLSGRESSILALIAQSQDLDQETQQRLLNSLNGMSLSIAKTMLGLSKRPRKVIKLAADAFKSWAAGLKER